MENIHPVLDIGEQKVLNLALAIVKGLRVPVLLVASITLLGVEVLRAIKLVDALVEILDIVGRGSS